MALRLQKGLPMDPQCARCGAKCCSYFCFQIDEPGTFEDYENIRWFLLHRGVSVHIDDQDDWYISIANECTRLGDDGKCGIYENRPRICRTYQTDGCDFTNGDYEYKELFETPEAFEAYARRRFGARYDRMRAKDRGEIAPRPPRPKRTRR